MATTMMRARSPWLPVLAFSIAFSIAGVPSPPATAEPRGPVEHEQIPPDPHEDLAFEVTLEGELPAVIQTKDGVLTAPDPRKAIAPNDPSSGGNGVNDTQSATFQPDRNTKRPDVTGYDEPFTPSTAPFKRLEAFDAVNESYDLYVYEKRLQSLAPGATPSADGTEDQFFADLVIDVAPGKRVRIPSVGPGARIVRARLGIGAQDLTFHVWKDGAENWYAEGYGATSRARLVMEITIPRGVFGGEFIDSGWPDLPRLPALPPNVVQSAKEVCAALGLSTAMRPREIVNALVLYFRSFVDSEEPPRGHRDIYLDLALSKKGVCRHRAFAFMITAQSLGIPTRMIINEAHAWVEVYDGVLWRRIDLGGAGRMVNPASNALPERAVHQPPPDAFQWPQGSERGEDMVEQARERARRELQGPDGNGKDASHPNGAPSGTASGNGAPLAPGSASNGATPPPSPNGSGNGIGPGGDKDDRPASIVSIAITDESAHRGAPLGVHGDVRADGEPCANVVVEVYLRDLKQASKPLFLGAIATNARGEYGGSIVVPGSIPLGDYDVVTRTVGDARCGRGGAF